MMKEVLTLVEFFAVVVALALAIVGSIRRYYWQRRHPNRYYWYLRWFGIKLRRWRVRPEGLLDAVERRRREREGPQ